MQESGGKNGHYKEQLRGTQNRTRYEGLLGIRRSGLSSDISLVRCPCLPNGLQSLGVLVEGRMATCRLRLDLVDLVRAHARNSDVVVALCQSQRTEDIALEGRRCISQRASDTPK